ncbi:hypothetical protein [Haliscomenobacter sp.]|uniref:hypothetical protein n=1 Tax=Haliscomenobacter sp. TaxID=2717303 RepID=UPI003BAA9340
MDYKITKPALIFDDQRLYVLAAEICNLSLNQLKSILEDFENIFKKKYTSSSFGYHTSLVSFDENVSSVEYHDEFIMELNSKELYDVLIDWYDKYSKWELIMNQS